MFGTVTNKKIALFGFSFKANTNDTRESPAINICKDLLEEGAVLFIHDPKVDKKQIAKDLSKKENKSLLNISLNDISIFEGEWCGIEDIINSSEGADAIIVLTEWEDYSRIDWEEISLRMRKPSWIFDARSIIFPSQVIKHELNLWRIGDGFNY